MALEFLTQHPVPSVILIVCAIALMLLALLRREDTMIADKVFLIIAFVFGIVALVVTGLTFLNGGYRTAFLVVFAITGFVLFLKPLENITWSLILALAIAGLVVYLLYKFLPEPILSWLVPWGLIIIFFILFLVIFFPLRALEFVLDFLAKIIGWRPVAFIVSILAFIEATLSFFGSSIGDVL
ncbi:MAG: hypothetical protein JSV43_03500 [Methanobacteriota archaeon]|nr:MAG: hypothetical protein JSV43_03500 [Euryarchaeota archaeon]